MLNLISKVIVSFLNRLQLHGFIEHKVQGDGNCQVRILSLFMLLLYILKHRHASPLVLSTSLLSLEDFDCRICQLYFVSYALFFQFRALSDQLYQTPDHHKHVRHQVVNQVSVL